MKIEDAKMTEKAIVDAAQAFNTLVKSAVKQGMKVDVEILKISYVGGKEGDTIAVSCGISIHDLEL